MMFREFHLVLQGRKTCLLLDIVRIKEFSRCILTRISKVSGKLDDKYSLKVTLQENSGVSPFFAKYIIRSFFKQSTLSFSSNHVSFKPYIWW